ncbi:hypothetical protein I302_104022 [Kwoniella bestiolae CBS 10118]|uniref:Uncharacterized protein n=1 Tax=Kwoniella bestiolae CBS 10118 TaxID=1296100 RepID=A0A1B9GA28_9TREE|nr:hypothetical protein I302_02727 [Kwoniella bestiolae CBS 10118]OCF27877.1 hypothetical protein I302_02727 [Kwoniella bestiolae CBS 10118]
MPRPTSTTIPNRFSPFTPILISLTTLSIYLITSALTLNRLSPPVFLTISLGLLLASYHPSLGTALIAISSAIFANLLLAIDYIHGECWYGVMVGGESWHKERLGELGWYRLCVQPAQAWWIMVLVGLIWLVIAFIEISRIYNARKNKKRILLPTEETQSQPI